MSKHLPIIVSNEYIMRTVEATIFINDLAWTEGYRYQTAELIYLAAMAGTKQKLQAIAAAITSKKSSYTVRAKLPVESRQYHGGTSTVSFMASWHDIKPLEKTAYITHYFQLPGNVWQMVMYPKAADIHTTDSFSFLVLPHGQPVEERKALLFRYLDDRIFIPMYASWIEEIWEFCLTIGMAREYPSIGQMDVFSLNLSIQHLKALREKISRSLHDGLWPLPERGFLSI